MGECSISALKTGSANANLNDDRYAHFLKKYLEEKIINREIWSFYIFTK